MENAMVIAALSLIGATLGSFVGAQVWRIRAKQLIEDEAAGESINHSELRRLKPLLKPVAADRSECIHCHHTLAWYDLLPIVSWLTLGGKCRYCKRPIGKMEILLEIGLAAIFAVSYIAWPYPFTNMVAIVPFAVWLLACVLMALLFAYDARWSLLPFGVNIALIGVGVVFISVSFALGLYADVPLWSPLLALGIIGGLYFIFSVAGWSGLGDSILGVGLALLLGRWELAFLAVFLANLLGSIMLIPLALTKRLHRKQHIPFGPFLIVGAIVSFLWGWQLVTVGMQASNTIITKLML